jgi:glycosyltransferase involved in cell wall biosynthesis
VVRSAASTYCVTDEEAPPRARRVAIVHYTAQPAIGGIESLIARECAVLEALGHRSVCVVGRGSGPAGTETIRIPAMDPSHDAVISSLHVLAGAVLEEGHPLVQRLLADLDPALDGCTDCWIHNALTVSLNPFLTVALAVLIKRRREIRWVAWSADISSTSRFVEGAVEATTSGMHAVRELVTWVAVSRIRREGMSAVLGLPPERVQVVNPPLDVLAWLDVGSQARSVVDAVKLLAAGPVVLVPAKALPHKCLDRAVRVGIALARDSHEARILITAAPSPHDPRTSAAVVHGLRRRIQVAGAESVVILLPDLLQGVPTDRTVRELMQLCDVVFLPSIEEGFGMPLREAASLGVPLVCTDIPVFREVAGDSAAYFGEDADDGQVASLVLTSAHARRNPARRSALTSMIQFRADVEKLLHGAVHPKV